MAGILLSTNGHRVSPAALPNSKDAWLSFDLECPLELKNPLIGPAGGPTPVRFVMVNLTPADAYRLAHALLPYAEMPAPAEINAKG